MTDVNEHTTGSELARVALQGRSERATAWLGYRLPELIGITGPAIGGLVHWPGWWAGTGLTLGWIATAPVYRRWRAHRATQHDTTADTTTTNDTDDSDTAHAADDAGHGDEVVLVSEHREDVG